MKWYKHFSKMRLDPKVKRLINEFGIEGYGVYNYILESIAFNLDSESPYPEIEENVNDLAIEMKIDTIKLEKIIKFCIQQNLFQINQQNNRIMCLKLLNHLDNTLSGNPEIKKILANFNKLQETLRNFQDLKADQIRSDQIRLDNINKNIYSEDENLNKNNENKKEQTKKQITKKNYAEKVTLKQDEFNKLCLEFGESDTYKLINKLNAYKLSKNKVYKSDYGAILNWVVEWLKHENDRNKTKHTSKYLSEYEMIDIPEEEIQVLKL